MDAAPAQPTPAPQVPDGLSPPQAYVAHKQLGLPDLDAAMATRDYLRRQADARGSFRNAQDLFVGLGKTPLTGDALRTQLRGEADAPIADAQQRASTRYSQSLADPGHPTNQALQALVSKALPSIPPNVVSRMTVYDAEQLGGPMKQLGEYAQQMGAGRSANAVGAQTEALTPPKVDEAQQIARKTGLEADEIPANAAAERAPKLASAAKTGAETQQVAPSAQAEQTLKGAQAGEASATAAHTRMLTSGEVVPGYVRGSIPIDEGEANKINDAYKDYTGSKTAIDEIKQIVGNDKLMLDPKKRADVIPRLQALMGQLRGSVGMRSLAGPEMEFAKDLIADPTKFSIANATGWSQNQRRFDALKGALDNSWNATVKAKGLIPTGGTAAPGPRINILDPKGQPHNLPANQVDDYLKANPGAKRA